MIYALVIAQTIQRAVDALADVAHRLLGGTHMHVLYVPLEPCQRREILIAGITAKIIAAAAGIQRRVVRRV